MQLVMYYLLMKRRVRKRESRKQAGITGTGSHLPPTGRSVHMAEELQEQKNRIPLHGSMVKTVAGQDP
jgi:hypothetical protein